MSFIDKDRSKKARLGPRTNKHFMYYIWHSFFIKEIDFIRFWESMVRMFKKGFLKTTFEKIKQVTGNLHGELFTELLPVIGIRQLFWIFFIDHKTGAFTSFMWKIPYIYRLFKIKWTVLYEILYLSTFCNITSVSIMVISILISILFFLNINFIYKIFSFFIVFIFFIYTDIGINFFFFKGLTLTKAAGIFFIIGIFIVLALLIWEQFIFSKRSLTLAYFFRNKLIDQLSLSLFLLLFAVAFVFSENAFMLFLTWIGLNLAIYALIAQFSFSLRAQEAAIRYFVLGLIMAGLFLFGLLLLYISFGTLNLTLISTLIQIDGNLVSTVSCIGASLIILVILFKLSAFPLQGWAPDVYEGSSWFTVSLMTLVVKPAFVIVLISCITYFSFALYPLSLILFFSGIGSILIGTFGAASQQKLKRFLAFSSISHIGFISLLSALSPFYPIWTFWYLLSYLLANFILLLIFSSLQICNLYTTQTKSIIYIAEIGYINQSMPFKSSVTLPLTIALCSLAGLPPFMGFFTKLSLLLSCIATDSIMGWVTVFIIFLLMPLSIFNYFRLLRVLWFGGASLSPILISYANNFFSFFSFILFQIISFFLISFFYLIV